DYYPQIDNGVVTWFAFGGDLGFDYEIFLWDGEVHQLTDNNYDDEHPQIDNGMVTWFCAYEGSDYEIFLWDGEVHQLTDNNWYDASPEIDNGMVTWMANGGGLGADLEIFLWDGEVHQLTDNNYDDYYPQIDNGVVTWFAFGGDLVFDYEIFLWDGEVHQLTDNNWHDTYPEIDNGMVTWMAGGGDLGEDLEIFLWDGIVHQLTDNNYNEYDPQIDNGMVTWHAVGGDLGADYEILLSLLRLDVTPPTIDHPDDVSYEEGTTGHNIIWHAFDSTPYAYSVKRNDVVVEVSFAWAGDSIEVDIDGLAAGTYTFDCTVWDRVGFSTSDTVLVVVYGGDHPPAWVYTPTDQVIAYGEAFEYELAAVDDSGIDHWLLNDTERFELSATYYHGGSTARIVNNVVLDPGHYGLNVIAFDPEGNYVSAIFRVTVIEAEGPPIWLIAPSDQLIMHNEPFDYSLAVLSSVGIESWWINNTMDFTITPQYFKGGSTAQISNQGRLAPGDFGLWIMVTDTNGQILSGIFKVTVTKQLSLKLSGSFDYLLKEEIYLQLACQLTEVYTGDPESGATITFDIYSPDGSVLLSGTFEEDSEPGVYIYTMPETMKDMKLPKGIYLVHARAVSWEGFEAVDMIQFHIDPPGDVDMNIILAPSIAGFGVIAIALLWRRRIRHH
ncbi:MAG: TolB family protein, partial [Candidatus Thorarchaeota archaeon]